jgi:hypothetical protein
MNILPAAPATPSPAASSASPAARSPASKYETEAAEKLQAQKDALATLKVLPKVTSDNAKMLAKQKVDQVREKIKQLKMLCAGDPKRLARLVAQLAKELGEAVKQYMAAGGSAGDVAASDTPQAAPQDSTSDEKTASATEQGDAAGKTNAPESGDSPSSASADAPAQASQDQSLNQTSQSDGQKSSNAAAAYQKTSDALDKQLQPSAADKDKADFLDEVRGLERKIKEALKAAKSALLRKGKSKDTDDADEALKKLDQEMTNAESGSTASALSTAGTGGTVNVSA